MLIHFHIFNLFFWASKHFLFNFKVSVFIWIVKWPKCPWAPPVRWPKGSGLADPPGPAQPVQSLLLSRACPNPNPWALATRASPPLRRIVPADSGHRRRRDVAHLNRHLTAIQIHRGDSCCAAGSPRPLRLWSPGVECLGDLVAADAPGAVAPPWCCCGDACAALLLLLLWPSSCSWACTDAHAHVHALLLCCACLQ
jgi:hypothetical protein